MIEPSLHVHVWANQEDDNPVSEVDLTVRDYYGPEIGMETTNKDSYVQFGGQVQGQYLEVRLSYEDIIELHRIVII